MKKANVSKEYKLDFICFIGATKLIDSRVMIILAKFLGRFSAIIMLQNVERVKIILSHFKDDL